MTKACWQTAFALAVLCGSPAWAQLEARRTLHGLDAVGLVIENVHPDAERRGVSKATLEKDIALRLEQAGVRVLANGQEEGVPGRPLLRLQVAITPLDDLPLYNATVTLQLRQSACLTRNLIICETVTTWEDAGVTHAVGVSRLASVQQDVRDMIDRFLDAYRAENPKQ